MKELYMICNAHIDPIWQWQWDEGVGVALSTFRTAAEFCEEYDSFVFNHNESLLYKWVKEYDPALFEQIKRLVKAGKWKIMGGWYLQPDCNMPSGESTIRQITVGNRFFEEEFGVKPETAVNFDPFGHSRGLVQILVSAEYKTYLFMRPDKGAGMLEELPQYFWWKGYGGAEIPAFRLESAYSTQSGNVAEDVRGYIKTHEKDEIQLKCWGIGDHGGGPSRYEWKRLNELIEEYAGQVEFRHSDPDSYFRAVKAPEKIWEKDLNPMFVGCYTSMSRLKKAYRELENALYATEKLAAAVACQGLMSYPEEKFREAEKAMLFLAFHDTVAGTISRIPEKEALQSAGYALEILERIRTRAFYVIASREAKALENSLPVFVYNPHPYPVKGIWECEYTMADYNWESFSHRPRLYRDGQEILCQTERESGNVPIEYRKRVVFAAELAPMSMERFDLFLEKNGKEDRKAVPVEEMFVFKNERMTAELDPSSGLITRYCVDGREIAGSGFCSFGIYADDQDPWGMGKRDYGEKIGSFRLMTPKESAVFAGVNKTELAPVRIIEDGAVRTVVETFFCYKRSEICVHYKFYKVAAYVDIDLMVYWNERDKLLRMELPTEFDGEHYVGQTMFGVKELEGNGNEQVCQKWAAVQSGEACLTVINDGTYGLCCKEGLHISLLRAPAHAAMPIPERDIIPMDRFTDRIDQGEHSFSFRIEGGTTVERMENVDLEAQVLGEKPHVLNIFPTASNEQRYQSPLTVEGGRLDALMLCGEDYLVRIFNPYDREQTVRIRSEVFAVTLEAELKPYQFKTYRMKKEEIWETNLFGEAIR